jgi:hypothetical protein
MTYKSCSLLGPFLDHSNNSALEMLKSLQWTAKPCVSANFSSPKAVRAKNSRIFSFFPPKNLKHIYTKVSYLLLILTQTLILSSTNTHFPDFSNKSSKSSGAMVGFSVFWFRTLSANESVRFNMICEFFLLDKKFYIFDVSLISRYLVLRQC